MKQKKTLEDEEFCSQFNFPTKILFSRASEIYVPSGHMIYVYKVKGRNFLGILKGHQCKVIGIREVFNEVTQKYEIISCDEKGKLFFWHATFSESKGEFYKPNETIPLKGKNLLVKYFNVLRDAWIYNFVSTDDNLGQLRCYPRKKTSNSGAILAKDVIPGPNTVDVSVDENHVAAVLDHRLFVAEIYSDKNKNPRTCFHKMGTHQATCVYFHPYQQCLVTGNRSGAICLWYNYFEMRPVKISLHWHTLPIADLYFSPDGDLYSGSGECVLVRWYLNADHKKSFIPRLGSPIECIVGDAQGSSLCLLHSDQSISVVNAKEMALEGILKRMSAHIPQDPSKTLSVGLLYHRPTQSFIKNGPTGYLQFFNPDTNEILHNLDITMCNFVTDERKKSLPNSEVTKAETSRDGHWLVTSEVCRLTSEVTEVILKFWYFSLQKQRWELNTSVQQAHADEVTAIVYSNYHVGKKSTDVFITCSEDGKFSVWNLAAYEELGKVRHHWNCRVSKEFRGLPSSGAAFSCDGSLLAVAFGSCVTLWRQGSYDFVGLLTHSYLNQNILDLAFGSENSSFILLTRCEDYICSWNLLSCSLLWRAFLPADCISQDPVSGLLALFSRENEIFFFEPNSCQPIASKKCVNTSGIFCASFSQSGQEKAKKSPKKLYYFDSAQNFLCVEVPESNVLAHDEKNEISMNLPNGHMEDEDKDDEEDSGEGRSLVSALRAKKRSASRKSLTEKEKNSHLQLYGLKSNLVQQMEEVSITNFSFFSHLDAIGEILPNVKQITKNPEAEKQSESLIRSKGSKYVNESSCDKFPDFDAVQKIKFDEVLTMI